MNERYIKRFVLLMAAASSLLSNVAAADDKFYLGHYASTPEDIIEINQVMQAFQSAILDKNGKLLSSLVLNSQILFSTTPSQKELDHIRDTTDEHYDGLAVGGFPAFSSFVSNSKTALQEKFYNARITQDDNLAWVSFDFEFLEDNVVTNYGLENWQLIKTDDKWKIFSVVWSSHGKPPAKP